MPTTGPLEAEVRGRCERRCAELGLRRRLGQWEVGPGSARLLEVSGVLDAVGKAAFVCVAAVRSAASTRQLSHLWVVPRALVGFLAATLFLGLGKVASALQTWGGFEERGRALSESEKALLRMVFLDSLDLEPLRIKTGYAGLASLTSRPFVHGHVLYLKDWELEPQILVHEAVHWWQYQHGGADYMLDSLWSQAFGRGYDWGQSILDTPWPDLEVEQQAAFIEHAFFVGYFETGRFVLGDVDLSEITRDAVAQLRTGRGAP